MKKKIIISLIILVVIIIIVAVGSSGHKKTAPIAPSKPPVALNYVTNTNNGSFITITATISPNYVTSAYMPVLCKYFSEQATAHSSEYYSGAVFDDSTAPRYLGSGANLTSAQNNDFNNHYILSYNYNPSTHNNVCNIFYGGQNGKEQSITY
ncbi:hypothetical protein M1512_01025 [Patescibacteria group bacterium]|nr:hypothetical protein [Patescibacteria group bacterium]